MECRSLSLNGSWDCALSKAKPEDGKPWPLKVQLPFAPEAALSGVPASALKAASRSAPRVERALAHVWYRRKLKPIPDEWADSRVLLRFGGVKTSCEIYVDGKLIGTRSGSAASFAMDVTDQLVSTSAGKGHEIILHTTDDRRPASTPSPVGKQRVGPMEKSNATFYTPARGICREICLESVPPGGRIATLGPVDASPLGHGTTWQLRLRPEVILAEGARATLRLELRAGRRVVAKTSKRIDGNSGTAASFTNGEAGPSGSKQLATSISLHVPFARPWSPDDPFLYKIHAKLFISGSSDDPHCVEYSVGLREVRIEHGRLLLNGRPMPPLRLVLDQGLHPKGLYTAPRGIQSHIADIQAAMRLGFNGARCHQQVFEPSYYEAADRLGFFVFAEYPDWIGRPSQRCAPNMKSWQEKMRRDWPRVVKQLSYHPSIIAWTPLNEFGPGNPLRLMFFPPEKEIQRQRFVRALYKLTKRADPTRPVHTVSGFLQVPRATDIWSIHEYKDKRLPKTLELLTELPDGAWTARMSAEFSHGFYKLRGYTGQPVLLAECGGMGWPATFHDETNRRKPKNLTKALENVLGTARLVGGVAAQAPPRMAGFCWTQLYDTESETNGLLLEDRSIKFRSSTVPIARALQGVDASHKVSPPKRKGNLEKEEWAEAGESSPKRARNC